MLTENTKKIIQATLSAEVNLTKDEKSQFDRLLAGGVAKVRLLSAKEACAILGISRRTLARYEETGSVHAIRQSARIIRFDADEVERLAFAGMNAAQ
jgi:LmbE family N-acetylglucosaminyl deacetylase